MNKKSIQNALTDETSRKAVHLHTAYFLHFMLIFFFSQVILVVGGYREISTSSPGAYTIVLKNRKGFVKLAIETGAALVPAITFGEVDVFEPIRKNSILGKLQFFVKKNLKFPLPLVRHFLPFQYPINTVLGAPIDVEICKKPSKSDVDTLHKIFCKQIEELFENHKKSFYGDGCDVSLVIE